jgi:hypothetical protein
MMHALVAFRTSKAPFCIREKLGRYADIPTSEMMEESFAGQIRAVAGGTGLSDVEVVAVASRAETNAVEKSRFKIVELGEIGEVALDVRTPRVEAITMFRRRIGYGRNRSSQLRDLA